MTRLALLMAFVASGAIGCSKPTEADCRKAISNMQRLMGTEKLQDSDGIESEVRRCKGGSTKKAVACAIKAQTLDDLRRCEFFKVPEGAKGIGETGSAPGSADVGSAAPGSAEAPGSAAPAGSADAGSAAGSATPAGSAAPTGSAGSAAPAGSGGSAAPAGSAAK